MLCGTQRSKHPNRQRQTSTAQSQSINQLQRSNTTSLAIPAIVRSNRMKKTGVWHCRAALQGYARHHNDRWGTIPSNKIAVQPMAPKRCLAERDIRLRGMIYVRTGVVQKNVGGCDFRKVHCPLGRILPFD